jgi:hypothetical protein
LELKNAIGVHSHTAISIHHLIAFTPLTIKAQDLPAKTITMNNKVNKKDKEVNKENEIQDMVQGKSTKTEKCRKKLMSEG